MGKNGSLQYDVSDDRVDDEEMPKGSKQVTPDVSNAESTGLEKNAKTKVARASRSNR